jgi:hypothetical protein
MKNPPIQNTMFGFGVFGVENTIFNRVPENIMFSRPDSILAYGSAKPAGPESARRSQSSRNTGDLFLKKYLEVL